jgi:hypothetical protein
MTTELGLIIENQKYIVNQTLDGVPRVYQVLENNKIKGIRVGSQEQKIEDYLSGLTLQTGERLVVCLLLGTGTTENSVVDGLHFRVYQVYFSQQPYSAIFTRQQPSSGNWQLERDTSKQMTDISPLLIPGRFFMIVINRTNP